MFENYVEVIDATQNVEQIINKQKRVKPLVCKRSVCEILRGSSTRNVEKYSVMDQ